MSGPRQASPIRSTTMPSSTIPKSGCRPSRCCRKSSNAEARGVSDPMAELTDKASARPSEAPVLQVRGLTKSYGPTRVVDNVSFDLDAGEVLTLLGPSGCGKSTTLRLTAGLEQPDSGELRVG